MMTKHVTGSLFRTVLLYSWPSICRHPFPFCMAPIQCSALPLLFQHALMFSTWSCSARNLCGAATCAAPASSQPASYTCRPALLAISHCIETRHCKMMLGGHAYDRVLQRHKVHADWVD